MGTKQKWNLSFINFLGKWIWVNEKETEIFEKKEAGKWDFS